MSASAHPFAPHAAVDLPAADSVYDPPTALFFFYLPALLIATGLVAWFVPNNDTFLLCTFVGSIVAVWCLLDLTILEGPVRFSRILAMTLLLGYALGALNSWYTIPRGSQTLSEFFIQDPAALARAQGAVLFACAVLLVIGEIWEKPLFTKNFKIVFDNRVIFFCVAGTAITLVAYATKALSFMGEVVSAATHELGVFPTLATWVISPAFALTVAAAAGTRSLSNRVMLSALALVQLACIFPLSRRTLLYSLIVAIIATRFTTVTVKLTTLRKLVILAVAGCVFYAGNIAFYYMRVGLWHQQRTVEVVSIVTVGRAAIHVSQQTDSTAVLNSLHENEQTRTFILGYFSDVLNGSLNLTPALGVDLLHQLSDATPRLLNPHKSEGRYLAEEGVAADYFGLKASDQANSVLTGGAIDFGIYGVLIYPIVLALLTRGYITLIRWLLPSWISTVMILDLVLRFLQPEGELSGILIDARNSLLFGILLVGVAAMPRIRLSLAR